MLRRGFIMGGAASLATPSLAVQLHGTEWHALGWSSVGRGEGTLVIDVPRMPPIWRLRLQLAGQGALVTRLTATYADGRTTGFPLSLFCPGPLVTRHLALGRPRRVQRIEIALSAPHDRRAVVRVFARLG